MKPLDSIETPEMRLGRAGDTACLTFASRPQKVELRSQCFGLSRRVNTPPSEGA
jgi:hypothetical protein